MDGPFLRLFLYSLLQFIVIRNYLFITNGLDLFLVKDGLPLFIRINVCGKINTTGFIRL